MSDTVFKQSLEAAVEELTQVLAERDELETRLDDLNYRMEKLREALRGLSALCGMDYEIEFPHLFPTGEEVEQGFTNQIRSVFRSSPSIPMSPVDVRNKLKESGFPVHRYSNALASIHTILKRLEKSREVDSQEINGKTLYLWADIPF